ncbi:MAG: hypothetical protein K2Y08_00845 [Alphaproteobacteria bacterium]|nr:hypothetical protein [Alphaproteobacteria bacterium]
MKHCFFYLLSLSLWIPEVAFSVTQASSYTIAPSSNYTITPAPKSEKPSPEPSVAFPTEYLRKLSDATTAMKAKGQINCTQLLNKTWAYPNALVTPFCYAAETSCTSLQLLNSAMSTAKSKELENLQKNHTFLTQTVYMNLYACVQALEAAMTNDKKVLPPLGYYAPFQGAITPSGK